MSQGDLARSFRQGWHGLCKSRAYARAVRTGDAAGLWGRGRDSSGWSFRLAASAAGLLARAAFSRKRRDGCGDRPQDPAKKVADAIAPRVLVPMHYRFGAHGYPEIGTLDEFLALYEAKKIHKLDGNSFELTKNAPAGVIVPRFAE